MRIWVVGAHGKLGRALCEVLRDGGAEYRATGHGEVDIADKGQVFAYAASHAITHIVNCAAYTDVEGAERDEECARSVNALGPENLGRAASELGARVIHMSTDYVFDGSAAAPYKEDAPCGPINAYGRTKREGEERLSRVFCDCCIVRTSWLYGTGECHFVEKMLRLGASQETVSVVADQMGQPTYAADLAQVLPRLLGASGIYHVANEGITTWHGFAQEIFSQARQVGLPLKVRCLLPTTSNAYPGKAERPAYTAFNLQKIEEHLGKRLRPWKVALNDYMSCFFE